MESRGKFEQCFLLWLRESSTVETAVGGSPGGFNPHEGNIVSKDSYNPNDSRIATPPGVIQTREGALKRKRKKKPNKRHAK